MRENCYLCAVKRCLLVIFVVILGLLTVCGQTQIAGYVRDSVTREPIPYASIAILGTTDGVNSNNKGGFQINSAKTVSTLRVSAIGYQTKDIALRIGQSVLVVDLVQESVELKEVVVKRTKEKYSKKDNPAVALAKRLMALKHQGNPAEQPYYSHDRYERLMYGFNDYDKYQRSNILFRKFGFLSEYTDTSALSGKRVLPVSVKDQFSQEYFCQSPKNHKELIQGQKNAGFDEQFDTQSGIKDVMNDWFKEIDLFQNDVTFLTNRFVSPLSHIGPDFYKYYLTDTLAIEGDTCIELSFTPFVSETFGFLGRLYVVENDTTLFIKKVKLNVPNRINVNFVDRVYIEQDFVQAPNGCRLKTRENMEIEFSLYNAPGLFARCELVYNNFSFDPPLDMSVFDLPGEKILQPHADQMPTEFWVNKQPEELKNHGGNVKQMLARLRQNKVFYWSEKTIMALIKGYLPTGNPSKWDFGPLNSLISFNTLEGPRMRIGGMSKVPLSPHWFFRAHVAYGFRDQKWKYGAQVEYSFNKKKELDMEFPIHSLRLRHEYEADRLGQHFLYTNYDNIFHSISRGQDNKLLYKRSTLLEWRLELLNHFSVSLGFEHMIREGTKYLPFMLPDSTTLRSYGQAGFTATLRYAPGEKFYQVRSFRVPINMDGPVLELTHTYMPKGFLGSRYEVNRTELSVQKRFWFSAFGYTDIKVKGGKLWSRVCYPDLLLPNASIVYTIQAENYALMDVMEFVNDQYLSWDMTYWANGALFNRIPLIKYLKLREILTFRGLWGSLSDRNDPMKNNDLFLFPADTRCQRMGNKPYMEFGVGIDNVFTFLRFDYVWRLTYRDTPGVSRGGLRVAFHATF